MAWSPIPHPYDKYLYEDPNAYTAVDPDLIKNALAGSGLYDDAASSIFSSWQNMMGGGVTPTTSTSTSTSGTAPALDYRTLIENDPAYKQSRADLSAEGISDASSRAAALKRVLIDWGLIPDFAGAGAGMGLSQTALGYLSSDIDPATQALAAQNEAQGLSLHSKLSKADQDNIAAIRNQLAARGMYQSGELGYGLEENARQYKQASTEAERGVLGRLEDVSGRYVQGERERRRTLAGDMQSAAGRALQQIGSTSTSGTTEAMKTAGTANRTMPANTKSVWDVNSASTYDALNAAKQSGGSLTIRPDDPQAVDKANAAAQAGVPVSIQVNGSGDDTPATLAARVQQYQQQFPGASFTLDLESPNFRDMTPGAMEAYAQAVQQVAGNTPLVITTEGVSDFNYGAWASNPNVIFAPQAYWGDMSGRSVQDVVNLLVAQGVDPSKIVPVVAPGQDLGGYTGPVSVYGVPSGGGSLPSGTPPYVPPPDPNPSYPTSYVSPVPKPTIEDTYYLGGGLKAY